MDADGGKLILTAGAPRVTGDDEERMLLALRRIIEAPLPLRVRIGVHRGAVFAGEIGPAYRRTYTVMGDAVNLAARLMAKAEPGRIYATADVLERSNTLFHTTDVAPFSVKGKTQPVRAWDVGRAAGSRTRQVALQSLRLIGRDAELAVLRGVLAGARNGEGRLVEVVGEPGLGKTRLLEALREDSAGMRRLHATCEAYTASTPYVLWRELLRELMQIARDAPDAAVVDRLRETVQERVPELLPWLPLIAGAFDVELPPTPEVEMLAEKNRRAKLQEVAVQFLETAMTGPTLVEIEDAHHMDGASAELLAYVADTLRARPWLFAVARRNVAGAYAAQDGDTLTRLELQPLGPKDSLRMARLASEQHALAPHALEVVAQRSGGNPQFLRDLLRAALQTGGVGGLPDSAEAAAMARIDALAPDDRALVRRAAVFGLTFHPRMLAWLAAEDGAAATDLSAWSRLQDFFEDDGEGYLRFRRSLLRDAAYEGLPYKQRRRMHGIVAVHLAEEMDYPEEAAGILSLHHFQAGEYAVAWQYAGIAAKRAQGVYAYVEAARLYVRAIEAGRLARADAPSLATLHEALAESWYRAAEYHKAAASYAAARRLRSADPLAEGRLLLKLSWVEEKLGKYPRALRWATRARKAVEGLESADAARHAAQSTSWYASVLQLEGRTREALRWARRAVVAAEAAEDQEALGEAYYVMGWAFGALGREGAQDYLQHSLQAYQQSGNLVRQAGLLSNLGVVCQWEGRWDEALAYYERGRDELLKIGNTLPAAVARINIAEILIDRGALDEAEELLQDTLPLFKAAKYRYFLGACVSLLGRASVRGGRIDDALRRLDEARANFTHVGAEEELPAIDARVAECRVLQRDASAALTLVDAMLPRAASSSGVARVVPLLRRVRACALAQQGDRVHARQELARALAVARERRDVFETMLTLSSIVALDRLERVQPDETMLAESHCLMHSLSIRLVPEVPLDVAAE